MTDTPDFDELVTLTTSGDLDALESLLAAVQHRIYRIALRMLGNPADAEDATQEILLKITLSLASFQRQSQFSTWVHRVATNHVLDILRQKKVEARVSFEDIATGLDRGLAYGQQAASAQGSTAPSAEETALAFEVFVGCTQRLLSALDAEDRIAYVLGDLCDLTGEEAAAVLQLSPPAFRQRLSRARRMLTDFLDGHCGVANPRAACRCAAQVPAARATGYVSEQRLTFTRHVVEPDTPARLSLGELSRGLDELSDIVRTARLLRSQGEFAAPERLVAAIRQLLDSGRYRILQ